MDLEQDEVFGASSRDGDLTSASFRFRRSEEDSDTIPAVGSIHRGTVRSVKEFGAFVRLATLDRDGLVHVSQMFKNSHDKNFKPSDVISVGDNVFVKVISIESSSGKLSLSIKYVNQTTGQDLDENGVELDRENQRRKEAPRRQEKSSALGAILNVTCSKCGGHGHLPSECFGAGKKYDLLPEDDGSSLLGITNGIEPFMDHKFSAPPTIRSRDSKCSGHTRDFSQHRHRHRSEQRNHDRESAPSRHHESTEQSTPRHHRNRNDEHHSSHPRGDHEYGKGTALTDCRHERDSGRSKHRDSGHHCEGHRLDDDNRRYDNGNGTCGQKKRRKE